MTCTLRYKLQIPLAILSSRSILTPGQPFDTDPIMLGAHQCSHSSINFRITGVTWFQLWFGTIRTTIGVRQGCLLSPTVFNILLERIMADAHEDHKGTVSIGGRTITNFRFAVDMTIDNKKLETVRSFKYLRAIVSDKASKPEVFSRIAQTIAAVTKLKVIWNDKNSAISSKIRLMRSLAMSIFLYACETWTITANSERRIRALEMRCFRKLLGISYSDHITNEEVKARIGNTIGPYVDFLTSVKRRKLKWYGYVTRSSGLAKTILQGTVQGGRRRGRQRKRWEDNIKEWTGLEWDIILRKAENREEWRKLVVKSTVVPQRSARLRDR